MKMPQSTAADTATAPAALGAVALPLRGAEGETEAFPLERRSAAPEACCSTSAPPQRPVCPTALQQHQSQQPGPGREEIGAESSFTSVRCGDAGLGAVKVASQGGINAIRPHPPR